MIFCIVSVYLVKVLSLESMKRKKLVFILILLIFILILVSNIASKLFGSRTIGNLFLNKNQFTRKNQPKSVEEIPFVFSDMEFNYIANHNYNEEFEVTWETNDFIVDCLGNVNGSFDFTNNGPKLPHQVYKDFLFISIKKTYTFSPMDDGGAEKITDTQLLESEESTTNSAKFYFSDKFDMSNIIKSSPGLEALRLDMTWFRVYAAENGYFFHILPADDYLKSQVFCSEESHSVKGVFVYYEPFSYDSFLEVAAKFPNGANGLDEIRKIINMLEI